MDVPYFADPTLLAWTALGLCLLAVLLMLIIVARQTRLLHRYRLLLNGESGKQFDQLLIGQGEEIAAIQAQLNQHAERVAELERNAPNYVQRTGVVRFNAFPDAGSDLSFAVAVMDANNNGFVISSLYGRHESRTYAKPIRAGVSTYLLTDEEKQAIALASGKPEGRGVDRG